MAATGVSALTVLMIVMIAFYVRIISESAGKKCFDRSIARAADTSIQLNTCLGKCHLCATADSAANECVNFQILEDCGKRAVSLTVGISNRAACDLSVFYVVNLKLLGVTEVLKDLSVFISYCNFHNSISLIFDFTFPNCQASLRIPYMCPAFLRPVARRL